MWCTGPRVRGGGGGGEGEGDGGNEETDAVVVMERKEKREERRRTFGASVQEQCPFSQEVLGDVGQFFDLVGHGGLGGLKIGGERLLVERTALCGGGGGRYGIWW